MNIEKTTDKLAKLFGLSKKKRAKKKHQEELLTVIDKLNSNKDKLQKKIQQTDKDKQTGKPYNALLKEYEVVTKMLKRAKERYRAIDDD
jgi:outer membrane murein-binding lipoprotein Lpp